MTKNLAVLMTLALSLSGPGTSALAAATPDKVSFEPLRTVAVLPGHATPVRFTFHVKPGYHINSNKPSMPELIPTVLHFSLPGDVVIGRMLYPAGKLISFPFSPSTRLSVYSGSIVITGRVVAPQSANSDTYTIHGDLKYQACDNTSCYAPASLPITFNVKVGTPVSKSHKARPNPQSPHIH